MMLTNFWSLIIPVDVDVPLDDNQRKNTVDALVNLFANYADVAA